MRSFLLNPFTTTNHGQRCLNVNNLSHISLHWVRLWVSFVFNPLWWFFLLFSRLFPHKSRQHFHHRPMILQRIPRDPLKRVNSTQTNIQLVASEQFNGFAETVCQFAFLSDSEVILCDFDILERGVKTKQQRHPA